MNKNIEDIIKEALESHDSGYVTGAWESMSARLDGSSPTPFYKKWWVAAAFGTVLVGTATFFLLNEQHTESPKKTETAAIVNNNTTTTNNTPESTSGISNTTPIDGTASATVNPFEATNGSGGTGATGLGSRPSGHPRELPSFGYFPATAPSDFINPVTNPTAGGGSTPSAAEYKKLALPLTVCLNEEVAITNPNASLPVFVTEANGKQTEISGGKKLTLTAKQAGTITVRSGEHTDYITVNENTAKLYIDVDPSVLFENGIPTLKFKVPGMKDNLTWSSNIKGDEVKGDTYIVHPYTEKAVNVTVTSTNDFGCKVEEQQMVRVEQPYNLLAPNGFRPNSSDVRNTTFMPYALTQRTVNFDMIVIDPRTGAVVYSTSDATQGWNGIDKRTGEMVAEGSVWAWRVIIKNPNVGEPTEYSGTITRM